MHWNCERDSFSGRLYLQSKRGRAFLSSRRTASRVAGGILLLLLGLYLLFYLGVLVQLMLHHAGVVPINGRGPARPITTGLILALAGGGLVLPGLLLIIYCGYGLHRHFVVVFDRSREEYRVKHRCWGWTTGRQKIHAGETCWVAQVTIRETPTSDQQSRTDRFLIASLGFAGPLGTLLQLLNRWGDRRMDRFAEEHPLSVGLVRLALMDSRQHERLTIECTDIFLADRFLKMCEVELDWDGAFPQFQAAD